MTGEVKFILYTTVHPKQKHCNCLAATIRVVWRKVNLELQTPLISESGGGARCKWLSSFCNIKGNKCSSKRINKA